MRFPNAKTLQNTVLVVTQTRGAFHTKRKFTLSSIQASPVPGSQTLVHKNYPHSALPNFEPQDSTNSTINKLDSHPTQHSNDLTNALSRMVFQVLIFLTLLLPSLASITPTSTTSSTLFSFGRANATQTYHGSKLTGEKVEGAVHKLPGMLNDGNYGNFRNVKKYAEGIVKKGLVVDVLRNRKDGEKDGEKVQQSNSALELVQMMLLFLTVIISLGILSCVAYRRNLQTASMFIDGPE